MNPLAYVHGRYAALGLVFMLASVGYAGWVAWTALTLQQQLSEETQRLLAENAQATSAAVRAREADAPR